MFRISQVASPSRPAGSPAIWGHFEDEDIRPRQRLMSGRPQGAMRPSKGAELKNPQRDILLAVRVQDSSMQQPFNYPPVTDETLEEVVRRIVAVSSPLRIVLFGSRARGQASSAAISIF